MKVHLIAALVAALSPLASAAGEVSHTYVEAGVGRTDFDVPAGFGEYAFDGGYLRGSLELGRGFYGFGAYARGRLDGDWGHVDLDESQLGAGYAHALSDTTDLISELGYVGREFNDMRVDGLRGSVGVRGMLGARVEGWAKANYTDGGDFDGDLSAQAGALYRLTPRWGLTGEVEANEDANRYTLGVRASF